MNFPFTLAGAHLPEPIGRTGTDPASITLTADIKNFVLGGSDCCIKQNVVVEGQGTSSSNRQCGDEPGGDDVAHESHAR